MTPTDLAAWMQHQRLNTSRAAAALGCTRNRLRAMLKGETTIPRYIALACMALAAGLPPWPPKVKGEG